MNKISIPLTPEQENYLSDILNLACEHFQVSRQKLMLGGRYIPLVFARACYVLMATSSKPKTLGKLSSSSIMNYINRDHATAYYYKNIYNNDNTFKQAYDVFRQKYEFMQTIKQASERKFSGYPELVAKFTHIEEVINETFKTKRFRDQHISKVKDIIWLFNLKHFHESMVSLYAWWEDFVNEYLRGDKTIIDEFELIGYGKDC